MRLEQRNGQLKTVELTRDLHKYRGFIPWYRGVEDSDQKERDLRTMMRLKFALSNAVPRVNVKTDVILFTQRPSDAVKSLMSEQWYKEAICLYLCLHGADISLWKASESDYFIRVVDGYIKKENRLGQQCIEPVYVDVYLNGEKSKGGDFI